MTRFINCFEILLSKKSADSKRLAKVTLLGRKSFSQKRTLLRSPKHLCMTSPSSWQIQKDTGHKRKTIYITVQNFVKENHISDFAS